MGLRRLLDRKWAIGCIRRDFLQDSGLAQQIDEQAFPAGSQMTLNSQAGLAAGFRFARSARLESAALFAATFGIEFRYPMLDRQLIQQFFATPSIEKRSRDMGRYLHRRAMVGRIPEQIVSQKTKFMGDFTGAGPLVEQYDRIEFSDLPEPLRSIIDLSLIHI